MPGLVVEKIDKGFVKRLLTKLPKGIVIISGTNGKTTTTKIVVELLESQGLRVFTNRTGSNFNRGIIASLLQEIDSHGRLDADIAVLELDEAHGSKFVKTISPDYCLLLNVMRDQLDRFGELEITTKYLQNIASHTTKGVVINQDDALLTTSQFTADITAEIWVFGLNPKILSSFAEENHSSATNEQNQRLLTVDKTILKDFRGKKLVVEYDNNELALTIGLDGIYNIQNAVGALALVRQIIGDGLKENAITKALSEIKPAFGRGEVIDINGTTCQLILVKNPAGFSTSLRSFDLSLSDNMIAINDSYADGRDMSWLWDVSFDGEIDKVEIVSGVRAYDMALRLQYDNVNFNRVEPDIKKALDSFLSTSKGQMKRIFCSYTAMLAIRKLLSKQAKIRSYE